DGVNHDRAAVPPGVEVRRSRAEIERALANVRALVRYLRDAPGLEPITVRELVRRYGRQDASGSRAELTAVATRALSTHELVIGESASAAETLLGFAESLAHLARGSSLPEAVARRDVLGPVEAPPLVPELPAPSSTQLVTLAHEVLRVAGQTGHLPAAVAVNGCRVGLGALYGAFAEAYLAAGQGEATSAPGIPTAVWPRHPAGAVALGERQRWCEEDPLVRPGLSTDAIALHARLQTWTLKPAQRR